MKKYLSSVLVFLFLLAPNAHALSVVTPAQESSDMLDITKYNPEKLDQSISIRQLLYVYFSIIGDGIPESYKYIKLEFTNVIPNTSLYAALQKGVYLDLVKNRPISLSLEKTASEDVFAKMVKTNFDEDIAFTK
jgi:hypothetical protein